MLVTGSIPLIKNPTAFCDETTENATQVSPPGPIMDLKGLPPKGNPKLDSALNLLISRPDSAQPGPPHFRIFTSIYITKCPGRCRKRPRPGGRTRRRSQRFGQRRGNLRGPCPDSRANISIGRPGGYTGSAPGAAADAVPPCCGYKRRFADNKRRRLAGGKL